MLRYPQIAVSSNLCKDMDNKMKTGVCHGLNGVIMYQSIIVIKLWTCSCVRREKQMRIASLKKSWWIGTSGYELRA